MLSVNLAPHEIWQTPLATSIEGRGEFIRSFSEDVFRDLVLTMDRNDAASLLTAMYSDDRANLF